MLMAIKTFHDLIVWQRGRDLTLNVYRTFKNCKDFSFKDQIQRASLSIPNNVAEGYARRSDKAFKNFLYIAKGSAAEVESMILIAHSLGYVSIHDQKKLTEQTQEVTKLLSGFINKL